MELLTIIFIGVIIYIWYLVQSGVAVRRDSGRPSAEDFVYPFEVQINLALGEYKDYECAGDIKRYWGEMLKRVYNRDPERAKEIAKQDLKQWALAQVSSRAFDMIASGQYHLMDSLTPEGKILAEIYRSCLKEAYYCGYIDEETLNKQLITLSEQIHETGMWA
jgi:hypothetical protein